MLTTLTAFAALTLVQAAEPMIDFSGVQDPLGGEPTRVLVLGTAHLNQLPEGALNPGDLDLVLARLEADGEDTAALNRLLKATALKVYGKQVAALSGDAWVAFLETHCESINSDALSSLANVYGPSAEVPSAETIAAARHWIRRHEVNDV